MDVDGEGARASEVFVLLLVSAVEPDMLGMSREEGVVELICLACVWGAAVWTLSEEDGTGVWPVTSRWIQEGAQCITVSLCEVALACALWILHIYLLVSVEEGKRW